MVDVLKNHSSMYKGEFFVTIVNVPHDAPVDVDDPMELASFRLQGELPDTFQQCMYTITEEDSPKHPEVAHFVEALMGYATTPGGGTPHYLLNARRIPHGEPIPRGAQHIVVFYRYGE